MALDEQTTAAERRAIPPAAASAAPLSDRVGARVEAALEAALRAAERDPTTGVAAPAKLAAAMRHAVFPGGARLRPRLCLAVSAACGDDAPPLADAAAAAVELLHCASLAHDDLPCFDDAALRRGRPSCHAAFGEPLAVLAGDALIVAAFGGMAAAAAEGPACAGRLAPLVRCVAAAVGMPGGITAGQGWESEASPPVAAYHAAKTGALFRGATMAGALAAGADPTPWGLVGDRLGEAYQVADDLADCLATAEETGKPTGQDAAHDRPNAVRELGARGAADKLRRLLDGAASAVPRCRGADAMRSLVRAQGARLAPSDLEARLARGGA